MKVLILSCSTGEGHNSAALALKEEFQKITDAFIHLKDVLPKVDVTKEENVDIDKQNIGKILKVGMPIIVEIKRDSYNKKGARASTHINLPGRYLVLLCERR